MSSHLGHSYYIYFLNGFSKYSWFLSWKIALMLFESFEHFNFKLRISLIAKSNTCNQMVLRKFSLMTSNLNFKIVVFFLEFHALLLLSKSNANINIPYIWVSLCSFTLIFSFKILGVYLWDCYLPHQSTTHQISSFPNSIWARVWSTLS